jgi:diguanylate cyclase (GGDEF)-like protein
LHFLDEELSRARRNEQPVALLIAELPEYWELAKSSGQNKMDDFLVAISQGLRQASREYDRLGRIAENRFALVLPGLKPAYTIAILDRLHEIAAESGITVYGRHVDLKLGGAFYPDDADGARNLLSVGERKMEGPSQRWEESLRALLRAGKTPPEAMEAKEDSDTPNRESRLVRPGGRGPTR